MTHYNHKLVNDLAWVIGSTSLIDNNVSELFQISDWYKNNLQRLEGVLLQQDRQPQQLQTYITSCSAKFKHSYRLGYYFEDLVNYWLNIDGDYELVNRGIALKSSIDKRTIGEIDFIIKHLPTNTIEHWEVAVKFYLGVTHHGESYWFGPNLKDRLDLKTEKLLKQQIQLSETTEAAEYLNKKAVKIADKRILLKGRLYNKAINELNDNSWCTPAVFKKYADDAEYIFLEKSYWLSKITDARAHFLADSFLTKTELLESYEDIVNSPQCVAQINNNREIKRFFIVPNGWEQKALIQLG